ncbi:MAG: SEL1-like repeat protein [Alphaproteobacteria bacterium]|nr:SEL1-like repeat protein [Alphaproteobacteria bacterium]MCW5741009.1 SEL1-like repeat protein [Alphaproteobacteria bacterium]
MSDAQSAYDRGDYPTALQLWSARALRGEASAQVNLGWMHARGQGTPRNLAEAIRWFRLAAEAGDASAQTTLGVMYAGGRGLPRDDVEAIKWFRLAAAQGRAVAQAALAEMDAEGRGAPLQVGRSVREVEPASKAQAVHLSPEILHSPAWRGLSGPAVKVWLELRSRFTGGNNGQLTLSLDEGARLLRLGKATVKRAFDELQDAGFIALTSRGQWKGRIPSKWAMTDLDLDGERATKAWQGRNLANGEKLGTTMVPSRD